MEETFFHERGVPMTDWLELARVAHREFGTRLAAVENWSAPTPATEWDTTDLVRHVVEEQQWVTPLLSGRTVAQAQPLIEELDDDLATEWDRYSAAALGAWESEDLDATVHLSYSDVSVEYYLREQISDITVHTWDLARAVGADEQLPEDLVAAVYADFDSKRDMLAASGLFAAPVKVASDASPQVRLLALTGRNPS